MGRMSVHILDDDREADSAAYMLEACGVEPDDFYDNERVITRENLEKNYKFLVKMVDVRQPGEALKNHINFEGLYNSGREPFFVLGYLILLTGAKTPEELRQDILEAADWKHEEGYWSDEDFALKRKIYLEDFSEKIRIHKPGQKLHTALCNFNGQDLLDSKVVVGINQFRDYCEYGKIEDIKIVNLDGWGLETIPEKVFDIKRLESLSLRFNHRR